MNRIPSLLRRLPLLLAIALLPALLASCGGPRPVEQPAADEIETLRKRLDRNPSEPERTELRDRLATLELEALGPQPPIQMLRDLKAGYSEGAGAARIAEALARAEYRLSVLPVRDNPEAMFAALQAWMEVHGKAAPGLAREAVRDLDDQIVLRLATVVRDGDAAVRLLRLVQRPEAPRDYLDRLATALGNVKPTPALIRGVEGFSPRWMTEGMRTEWMRAAGRSIASAIGDTASAGAMLAFVRTFEGKVGEEDWEQVRGRYDDQMVARVDASPSRSTLDVYLADSYTRKMKDQWVEDRRQLNEAIASEGTVRLTRFIADHPDHPLLADARQARVLRVRVEELAETKKRLVEAIGKPENQSPVRQYVAASNAVPPQIFSRGVVSIDFGNQSVAGLALYSTGLLLGFDNRGPDSDATAAGQVTLGAQRTLTARLVSADPLRGFALFQLEGFDEAAKRELQAVRFKDSRLLRQGDKVFVVGTYARVQVPVWVEGSIYNKGRELRGSSTANTLHINLDRVVRMESGIVFSEMGEAIAVVAKLEAGTRVTALGLVDATATIEAHFDRLISEIGGSGPDAPHLSDAP